MTTTKGSSHQDWPEPDYDLASVPTKPLRVIRCPNKTLGCDYTSWTANCAICGAHRCRDWVSVWSYDLRECYCPGCYSALAGDSADDLRRRRKNMLDGDPQWRHDEGYYEWPTVKQHATKKKKRSIERE